MKPCGVCGVVCRVIVCYRSSLSRVARCVVHDCFSSEHLARSKTHGKTRDARPLETLPPSLPPSLPPLANKESLKGCQASRNLNLEVLSSKTRRRRGKTWGTGGCCAPG